MSIFSKTPNNVPAIPKKSMAEISAIVEISEIFGLRDIIEYQILCIISPILQTFLWQSFGSRLDTISPIVQTFLCATTGYNFWRRYLTCTASTFCPSHKPRIALTSMAGCSSTLHTKEAHEDLSSAPLYRAYNEVCHHRTIQWCFMRTLRRDADGDIDESLIPDEIKKWYDDSEDAADTCSENESDCEWE